METTETKQALETTFDGGDSVPLPIALDAVAKRKLALDQKKREQIADAEAYAQLGSKILRITSRTEALLGQHADKLGIKLIAKGRILARGHDADGVAQELGALVTELRSKSPGLTAQDIVELYRVRREYMKLSLETAEMLLQADAAAGRGTTGNTLSIPYAAGSSLAVAIGQPGKGEEPKLLK